MKIMIPATILSNAVSMFFPLKAEVSINAIPFCLQNSVASSARTIFRRFEEYPQIGLIDFVSNHHHNDIAVRMIFQLGEPLLGVLESLLASDIVTYERSDRSPIVGVGDCSVSSARRSFTAPDLLCPRFGI